MTNILCLDSEGGHGGSSRSLFFILDGMELKGLSVEVWCKKDSWIVEQYSRMGVICRVYPEIPKFTAVKTLHGNLVGLFSFIAIQLPLSVKFIRQLILRCSDKQVVHINHISLVPLAFIIRLFHKHIRIITHIRTMPPPSLFSRIQAKLCNYISDQHIFITENERQHFQFLCDKPIEGQVIYNPIKQQRKRKELKTKDQKRRVTVLSLSNLSFERGIDRILQVAECLPKEERQYFLFILAGDIPLQKKMFSKNRGFKLKEKIERAGLESSFSFTGHVSSPEHLIETSDVLLKLTREDNPWGRDILEALGAGLPVASVGSYDKFVKTNRTGLLLSDFDPNAIAKWLVYLSDNPFEIEKLSHEAIETIRLYNSPKNSARLLKDIWMQN